MFYIVKQHLKEDFHLYLYVKCLNILLNQLFVSCSGGRWPVDGLHQQPCSHQPNVRVGHSRGFFNQLDLLTGTRTSILKRRWDEPKDEHFTRGRNSIE
jgi:hypothetical protein